MKKFFILFASALLILATSVQLMAETDCSPANENSSSVATVAITEGLTSITIASLGGEALWGASEQDGSDYSPVYIAEQEGNNYGPFYVYGIGSSIGGYGGYPMVMAQNRGLLWGLSVMNPTGWFGGTPMSHTLVSSTETI